MYFSVTFPPCRDILQDEATLVALSPADLADKSKQMGSLGGAVALSRTWDALMETLEESRQILKECDVSTKDGREMAALGNEPALCLRLMLAFAVGHFFHSELLLPAFSVQLNISDSVPVAGLLCGGEFCRIAG